MRLATTRRKKALAFLSSVAVERGVKRSQSLILEDEPGTMLCESHAGAEGHAMGCEASVPRDTRSLGIGLWSWCLDHLSYVLLNHLWMAYFHKFDDLHLERSGTLFSF